MAEHADCIKEVGQRRESYFLVVELSAVVVREGVGLGDVRVGGCGG